MATLQIKDVPDEVLEVMRRRAATVHKSLEEYLRSRLIEEASRPTLAEVVERSAERSVGAIPIEVAVEELRQDRARH